ncbi:alpha/beta hydrolase [Ramlibacter sp. AW1]|uniref:Alpha/beta hydrolase n=1 Tax=Ramlibacter aurantiacus TaxID=2801330 RepID=A0A936ZL68_9BURK|nr:alpha/beta hydrolase [Ramlibacter aurantiacus]MBL0421847.1 alpha/beta hydrolase [Ramlibacter aurantiacus]
MRPQDYPAQEPLSPVAQAYQQRILAATPQLEGSEFAYGDDPYQRVLLYPAPQPNGDVLLLLHGGGWTNGYKEWMTFMAPALQAAGVTVATAGYRLAPAHLFPAGFEDCCAALAACAVRLAQHGGGFKRLFVGGHSAGGHLAALMAVRRDWQQSQGLPPDIVRGCLPISGVYRFDEGSGLSVRPRFLGPADSPRAAEVAIQASPLRQIQGTPPPFLMACGSADFPHLIQQAEEMRDALVAAGGQAELMKLPGCDHFGAHLAAGDADGPWAPRAIAWMAAAGP